jgi:hypothetical protein
MNRSNSDLASKADGRNAAIIFGAAYVIYLVFRSRFYIGDGVRYLPDVLGATAPADGGNGHFLWPYVLWIVCRACSAIGVLPVGDGLASADLIALLQGVNAFAGALALALLYGWLRQVASRRAALVAVALTGLSHAFLLHATDMTEPMAAVAPMMLGLLLLGSAPEQTWARLAAGALIGFGGDFYQIALFAVAPAVWLAARPRGSVTLAQRLSRLARAGLEIGGASVAVFVAVIAGVRFALNPGAGWVHAVASVRTVSTAGGLVGSFAPKHFAAWIFGLANALAQIPPNEGIGRLLRSPPRDVLTTLTILALAMAFLAGLVVRLVRSRRVLGELDRGPEIQAAVGWFFLVVFMACVWSVLYEKFWLFALLPLSLLVALAIDTPGEPSAAALGDAAERSWPIFLVPAAVLLVWNFGSAVIPRRFAVNADMRGVGVLSDRLQPADLLVSPGWDALGVYLGTLFQHPIQHFSVVDEAIALGSRRDELGDRLAARVAATQARRGRVYFLALLDMSRDQWDLFYSSRLHIPFEVLDRYRSQAVPLGVVPAQVPESLYEWREGEP